MPPHLSHGGKIKVELVILRMGKRRRFGIRLTMLSARIGSLQDIQTFRIRSHDAKFDTIMDHFDEMPCPDGPQCR